MSDTSTEVHRGASYKVRRRVNAAREVIQAVYIDVGDGANESPVTLSNPLPTAVVASSCTGVTSGRKEVALAGTAESLVAVSTPCRKVDVMAETDNTGVVVVGGSRVVAAQASRAGIPLQAGQFYSFEIDNAAKVYLDVTVDGDGVTYNIWTR